MPKGLDKDARLEPGEYAPKGVSVTGQMLFLDALVKEAPHLFDQLAAIEEEVEGSAEEARRTFEWCRTFHLTDQWLVDVACRTLWSRRHMPGFRELQQFEPPPLTASFAGDLPAAPRGPQLPPPYWPESVTAEQYLQQARAEVESYMQRLGAYVLDVNAAARDTQHPGQKRQPQHFVWLVRYQALEASYKELVPQGEPGTVRKALKRTAKLIGLSLRAPADRARA